MSREEYREPCGCFRIVTQDECCGYAVGHPQTSYEKCGLRGGHHPANVQAALRNKCLGAYSKTSVLEHIKTLERQEKIQRQKLAKIEERIGATTRDICDLKAWLVDHSAG